MSSRQGLNRLVWLAWPVCLNCLARVSGRHGLGLLRRRWRRFSGERLEFGADGVQLGADLIERVG